MTNNKKTLIAIYCSDPRFTGSAESRAIESFKNKFENELGLSIESVDFIRIPGPDALAVKYSDEKRNATTSFILDLIGAHNVVGVAIAGHSDCAGNQASDEDHRKDTISSAEYLHDTIFQGPVGAFLMFPPSDGREERVETLKLIS
ncbi:MAG: carbonic anhydrase [Candidatus Campbellbacteria bacterium]|nr:carbonic anhydrase [Candidatus Campbellbacteria bacterium]